MNFAHKIVRLGLIGAGGIAQAYSAAMQTTANYCRLVSVADVDRNRAEKFAIVHGATFYDDHRQMLENSELDGVIVCSPPANHPEHCMDFLAKGVHVLCEKPIAINLMAARSIIDVAEQSGALFTMASKFRFVEDIATAREMIHSGKLGEIVLFENVFASYVDMSKRWNSQPAVSGGGVLIDNGTHSLDLMQHLVGQIAEIRVIEGKRLQGLEVEDTVNVFARTEDGIIGNIDLSWTLNKQTPFFASVYGTRGTVQVGWKSSQYKLEGERDWTVFGSGYDKHRAFSEQLRNFCLAINGQEALIVTPEQALASVAAVESAYQAFDHRAWEPVSTF